MMPILNQLLKELNPFGATLVAVSKTKSVEAIRAVYNEGQKDFGENRVQELLEKIPQLPADIRWHLIGHLQTNKVKYLDPSVALIHSVDSVKLMETLQEHGKKIDWKVPILLQLKIAQEDTKSGFERDDLLNFLSSRDIKTFSHLEIKGVMGIGTLDAEPEFTRIEFKRLKDFFVQIRSAYFQNDPAFKEVSMGMSHDYRIALEEGATMVRIGSLVFGERV